MEPIKTREAVEMFKMALALVEARGDQHAIARLNDKFIITSDVPLLGRSYESNCSNILVGDRWVLRAVYADDGSSPRYVEFCADAALEMVTAPRACEMTLEESEKGRNAAGAL